MPNIPPKKAVGNKDIEFVLERMYFLERFMMKLSDVSFLKNGQEVKIFARPEMSVITPGANTTEIDKLLLHY